MLHADVLYDKVWRKWFFYPFLNLGELTLYNQNSLTAIKKNISLDFYKLKMVKNKNLLC